MMAETKAKDIAVAEKDDAFESHPLANIFPLIIPELALFGSSVMNTC